MLLVVANGWGGRWGYVLPLVGIVGGLPAQQANSAAMALHHQGASSGTASAMLGAARFGVGGRGDTAGRPAAGLHTGALGGDADRHHGTGPGNLPGRPTPAALLPAEGAGNMVRCGSPSSIPIACCSSGRSASLRGQPPRSTNAHGRPPQRLTRSQLMAASTKAATPWMVGTHRGPQVAQTWEDRHREHVARFCGNPAQELGRLVGTDHEVPASPVLGWAGMPVEGVVDDAIGVSPARVLRGADRVRRHTHRPARPAPEDWCRRAPWRQAPGRSTVRW